MKKRNGWVFLLGVMCLVLPVTAFAGAVPDTGQTQCYDDAGNVIACPSPGERFYGQDGNYAINPMSYTRLDGGNMVQDNVTGLIWEVKNNQDGVKDYGNPRDADNTYTWYDPNPATNGGYAGADGDGTDTADFINALNSAHFGGYSDWRLPTIKELDSIVDYNVPYPGPCINTAYFPNTAASEYWSSNTIPYNTRYAWVMLLNFRGGSLHDKNLSLYVRAVRGGQ